MSVTTWLDTIFGWLGHARYNASGPTAPTDGQLVEMQANTSGHLKVEVASQTAAPLAASTLWTTPGTSAAVLVIKAGAGKLHTILATNDGASDRYLFLYDNPSAASGTVIAKFIVKTKEAVRIPYERPRVAATGIYAAVSSTLSTYTADGAATFSIQAEYE